jgi:endonuclease YncB( thermonuclease family)
MNGQLDRKKTIPVFASMFNRTSALTLLTALLLCSSVSTFSQTAPLTGEGLVARVLDARGGLARLKAIRSQRISGSISFGPGAEGPFVVELKRPGKMHMEVTVQDQTIVRIYDGHGSGWIINPFAENKKLVPMSGNDLKNITDESDFDGPLVDYAKKGTTIALEGTDKVEDNDTYRLKLTFKNGSVQHLWIDAKTFLEAKIEGTPRRLDGKSHSVEVYYRDFRPVSGLMIPFVMETKVQGIKQTEKILVEKATVNPAVEDSRFAKLQ